MLDPHERRELPRYAQVILFAGRLAALPCGLALVAWHTYRSWRFYR